MSWSRCPKTACLRLPPSPSASLRPEIQALLLSDCLVLLQKGPDERLQLRYPSRGGDGKTSFSPVVKLDSLLVRSVATSKTQVALKRKLSRFFYHTVLMRLKLGISVQTTKPSTSSAPRRVRSTSWWPGIHRTKTRKTSSSRCRRASRLFFCCSEPCAPYSRMC